MSKHIFALFFERLTTKQDQFDLTDLDLVRRVLAILRLTVGDQLIFFNRLFVAQVIISDVSKKSFRVTVESIQTVKDSANNVRFFLPLLKGEHLKEAIYALTEVGVSSIHLVVTAKTHRKKITEKEFLKLEKTIIAAAEQSKNYNFPILHKPIPLEMIESWQNKKIFFDAQAKISVKELERVKQVDLLVGPEADLTEQEKEWVKQKGFVFCKLTKTILRAVQAVALAAGIVISL